MLEEDGTAVAGGWLDRLDDFVFAGACVRPSAHGRGLGTWLVAHSEAHARALGFGLVRQVATSEDTVARALFEARGYRDVRHHYEMAIGLIGDIAVPEVPAGLTIDAFRTDEAEAFHAASAESFEDEWGFVPMQFSDWWAMRSGDPAFDPSLWFVVRDGAEIAAVARCEGGRHGGGFVGMLGVRKPWRRLGLGRALLLHAFREFQSRGFERATLGVDAENPTGATRLYESVGMRVESEQVTFEKELS